MLDDDAGVWVANILPVRHCGLRPAITLIMAKFWGSRVKPGMTAEGLIQGLVLESGSPDALIEQVRFK